MSMTPEMVSSLIYLMILVVAVIGWLYFSSARNEPAGPAVQKALIWLSVFVAVVAGYGLWQDFSRALMPRQAIFAEGKSVSIPRARDGHFYLTLDINEVPVSFVVDTGATDLVLSPRDAVRIGLDPQALSFSGQASTANGTVPTARVTLDKVTLGPLTERDVPAVVNGGTLGVSLLGIRYLKRWSNVMMDQDRMVLMR